MTAPILAAGGWRTNSALIADVAELHLNSEALTLDATYGRGLWWKQWRPDRLVTVDLSTDAELRADFRRLPFPDGTFPQIAYDPPYVSQGGRDSSTLGRAPAGRKGSDFSDRYGLYDAPTSPAGVQGLIDDGLAELARVAAPKGRVLVKCQSYISSGRMWPGAFLTAKAAVELGFRLVDEFVHVAGVRPQPPHRRQVHARRNESRLLVLEAA